MFGLFCLDQLIDLLKDPLFMDDDIKPVLRSEDDTHGLEQRIYLLRMRLLHFINGFHDYIMTTVSMIQRHGNLKHQLYDP